MNFIEKRGMLMSLKKVYSFQ